ncbi:MAG TPA: M23 family metallopeptidase [Alphaproteobacteria bacterium]|nr:M23 family metallopeptidase [Alphaproteobacteria bacterium]
MIRAATAILLAVTQLVTAAGAAGAELRLDGRPIQGGLIVGQAAPGARVAVDGRAVRVAPDGRFLIGFGREAGPNAILAVIWPDGTQERRALDIAPRAYDIQRIDGLPERLVSPALEDLARIKQDSARIAAARQRDTAESMFASGFAWPAIGAISGVYGSQRILNGQPRQPHFGVDIAAPTGTPVAAPADAIVVLTDEAMFFTGKTLMLDHGHGLTSVFAHLSEIAVGDGERVRKGQIVGRLGATGRVTGAHLHWGMALFGVQLDPALLVPPMPAPAN